MSSDVDGWGVIVLILQAFTVEPHYRGHHDRDPAVCPVCVPNSEVDLYAALQYVVGTADSVLIGEVSFIQSVLCREVPLYWWEFV